MDEMFGNLLNAQDGVISRAQAIDLGADESLLRTLLRRRIWARALPGVYVNHTGQPTWLQHAWAGVLHAWPAALAGDSALRATAGPGWRHHDDSQPIEVVVDASRRVLAPAGYRISRQTDLASKVMWNVGPPRLRFDEAVISIAARQVDPVRSVAVLTDAVGSRRTTAARLLETLDLRSKVAKRSWLRAVLRDIDDGTHSVLEHGYLKNVEQPHGLPRPTRQRPDRLTSGKRLARDIDYEEFAFLIETDGAEFHDEFDQRQADLNRDVEALTTDKATIRIGWQQVFGNPCTTAVQVSRILQRRGWNGTAQACGPDCAVHALRPAS